jgi:NAD-dependent deacetylase
MKMNNRKKVVVLTGAGISAESGLKTFRDAGGLWEGYRVEEVASPEGWKNNAKQVLEFYNQRRKDVINAKPNAAHLSLASLEDYFDVTIVTQNIDDLHERAGSKDIIHLHGEILKSRSSADEGLLYECREDIHLGDFCGKNSQLRPHIVWFGEAVPKMDEAILEAAQADLFLVVGTSLQVYPAASLLHYTKPQTKKFLVDVNIPEVYPVQNLSCIKMKATEGVPLLVRRLIEEFST